MIDRKHRLSVTRQAQLLGLSRGAVYYQPQPGGAADLALMRRLDELHLEHPFMGARMLRRQLQSGTSFFLSPQHRLRERVNSSCTEDGSWPPEAGLQGQASNRPVLLR